MGQIRKLSSGKYQADVFDSFGKRLRRNFLKKTDAQAYINLIEKVKYDTKLTNLNLIRKRKSITEAIDEARVSKDSLSKNSIKKYHNVFHQFELFILNNKLVWVDEFLPEHATLFSELLKDSNAASKTVNFYLMTIKAIFQDLLNMDYIQKNPFAHVKNMKSTIRTLKQREEEYYTENEILALLKVEVEQEYKEALLALYLTGMRVEELSSLKWQNIDLENKLIQIRTDTDFRTKTASSERDIPMSNLLFTLLKSKQRVNRYVFPSRAGKKLSERTLLQVCKRAAKEAGINKNATLHKFRHTFNSHLTSNGISFEVRQYMLGHRPQTMTDRYTKLDPAHMQQYLECLDKVVEQLNKTNSFKY